MSQAAQQRMPRSPSKDGYLMVPDRQRGSSLPEGREQKKNQGYFVVQRRDNLNEKKIASVSKPYGYGSMV